MGELVKAGIRGLLPPAMKEVLCASSLVPLKKGEDSAKVRPVAVGDFWRRLIGKTLLKTEPMRGAVRGLVPEQVGVGEPHACEMVGMGLQAMVMRKILEGDRDFVVLQVDLRNAFNCISRKAVLEGAAKHAPSMSNWLQWCYGDKATPIKFDLPDKQWKDRMQQQGLQTIQMC